VAPCRRRGTAARAPGCRKPAARSNSFGPIPSPGLQAGSKAVVGLAAATTARGSVRILAQAISNYIACWNEDAASLEWAATADEILEKVALVDRDFRKLLRRY
jgi:hypothetical protein